MNNVTKRAFTLIELLVVIAIIAILAAILFPVFAQAKEAAKKTQSLSNIKQQSLASIGYMADTDDFVPMGHTCNLAPPLVKWFCGGNSGARQDWNMAIKPYVKTPLGGTQNTIFFAPGLEADYYGTFTPNPVNSSDAWVASFTPYGYNIDYLQPAKGCSQNLLPGAAAVWGQPVSTSQMEAPADTVFYAETKPLVILGNGAFYPSNLVDSPADAGPNATSCGLDGWGVDDSFEPESLGGSTGVPNTSTAQFMPRHTNTGVVTFCDGHAKALHPGALAAGTSWHVGISASQVQILDLSKYLWSLKKSGSDL